MKMTGKYRIQANRKTVWDALNDPAILARAIPGCEQLTRRSDTEMEAVATVKVGPVKARFHGQVTLSHRTPPRAYTIEGAGKGGAAGFAKGKAEVTLEEDGEMTLLHYEVTATVGGKLAQIGQRYIDQTAKKMADEFFRSFTSLITAENLTTAQAPEETMREEKTLQEAPREASEAPPEQAARPALSPAVWISGLIAFIVGMVLIAGRLTG